MKSFAFACALAVAAVAVPAGAVTVVGATKVTVTNAYNTWLQVAELQAFSFGNVNVAAASNGATATGTGGAYDVFATPDKAIDGNTGGGYYTDTIFHPAVEPGTQLDINFASATNLESLTIWGRTDCCQSRDSYIVTIFGGNTVLYSGTLNAFGAPATVMFDAVPEPESWVLLVAGFGLVGATMRRRQRTAITA